MSFRDRGSLRGFVALGLLAAIAVAGCGSGSASGGVGSSSGPSVAVSRAASIAPSDAPSAAVASADPILAGAGAALDALTSYQFHVTMTGGSYSASMGPNGVAGTVVNAPSFAVHFTYADLEIIEIHGKNWTKNGASWDLSPYPDLPTTYDSYGPAVLLAHDFTPFAGEYSLVGDETVNGVAVAHYTCNPKALGWFSGIYGFAGDATVAADVWIARTGGYPARFEVKASGTAQFDLRIDITKANDPTNVINVPTS